MKSLFLRTAPHYLNAWNRLFWVATSPFWVLTESSLSTFDFPRPHEFPLPTSTWVLTSDFWDLPFDFWVLCKGIEKPNSSLPQTYLNLVEVSLSVCLLNCFSGLKNVILRQELTGSWTFPLLLFWVEENIIFEARKLIKIPKAHWSRLESRKTVSTQNYDVGRKWRPV